MWKKKGSRDGNAENSSRDKECKNLERYNLETYFFIKKKTAAHI